MNEKYIVKQRNIDDGIEFTIDIRKIEINEFIKQILPKISIIDIDIDNGNIDELIVKLYEEFKI